MPGLALAGAWVQNQPRRPYRGMSRRQCRSLLVHSVHTAGPTVRPVGLRFTGGTTEARAVRLPHGSCKQGLKWITASIFRPGSPASPLPDLGAGLGTPGGRTSAQLEDCGAPESFNPVYSQPEAGAELGEPEVCVPLTTTSGWTCHGRDSHLDPQPRGTRHTQPRAYCGHTPTLMTGSPLGPQETARAEGSGPDFLHPWVQPPPQSEEA